MELLSQGTDADVIKGMGEGVNVFAAKDHFSA